MILDKIYISSTEPSATNILWARPLEGGAFSLYAFISGKWGLLKLMDDKGTPYPGDDASYDCYTKEEIDERFADILGLDAEGIAELKALIEDEDALTGLLSEIARKANTADLAPVATSGSYNDLSDKPDLSGLITNSVDNLVNYYLKSETYTKTEVDNKIGDIETLLATI